MSIPAPLKGWAIGIALSVAGVLGKYGAEAWVRAVVAQEAYARQADVEAIADRLDAQGRQLEEVEGVTREGKVLVETMRTQQTRIESTVNDTNRRVDRVLEILTGRGHR